MKRVKFFLVLFFFPFCLFAQKIDSQLVAKINKTVVEVVIKKPVEGKVQYERELPFENLDYKIRTDPYFSVGTAFVLEDGNLLSAAHVFSGSKETILNDYYIRDCEGKVYSINNVYKYSDHKDFILFDAVGFSSQEFLSINPDFKINDIVYAVGNALGDGIVIRDGLLTSVTPESEAGAWKWLRFSAAASPGNSGGPLLDIEGRVIGLIAMKSLNENLNYALPISEFLNSPDHYALSHKKIRYSIPVFANYVKNGLFSTKISLPLSYETFHNLLKNRFNFWIKNLVEEVKKEWAEKTFPKGKGSEDIIYSLYHMPFPAMIAQKQDGGWSLFKPQSFKQGEFENEGSVIYGQLANFTMAYLKKPKNLSLELLYTDSKIFMDTLLSGLPYYRQMGGESIRITSIGKAVDTSTHFDRFGREWIVAEWRLDYMDTSLLAYILPVPEGAVAMINIGSPDDVYNGYRYDSCFMSDYIYLSYEGSFGNWIEFLKLKQFLPQQLRNIQFGWQDRSIKYKDDNFIFDGDVEGVSWSSDSRFSIEFAFSMREKEIFWGPRGYILKENQNSSQQYEIKLVPAPKKAAPENFIDWHNKILNRNYPYDGRLVENNGISVQFLSAKNVSNNNLLLISGSSSNPDQKKMMQDVVKNFATLIAINNGYEKNWDEKNLDEPDLEVDPRDEPIDDLIGVSSISPKQIDEDEYTIYYDEENSHSLKDQILKEYGATQYNPLRPWSNY